MKLCAACLIVFAGLPLARAIWWPFGASQDAESRVADDGDRTWEVDRRQEDRHEEAGRPGGLGRDEGGGLQGRNDYEYEYYYYDEFIPVRRSGDYYYYYQDDIDRQSVGSSINPLAALIAPLAGLALLGAASAVAVNPILLELVTIRKNRRRRSIDAEESKSDKELRGQLKQLRVLETFISSIPSRWSQSELLTAGYLSCSGLNGADNHCLEQLTCSYAANKTFNNIEKDVTSIVLYNLMSNKVLPPSLKKRIRRAARVGRDKGTCSDYICDTTSIENLQL